MRMARMAGKTAAQLLGPVISSAEKCCRSSWEQLKQMNATTTGTVELHGPIRYPGYQLLRMPTIKKTDTGKMCMTFQE